MPSLSHLAQKLPNLSKTHQITRSITSAVGNLQASAISKATPTISPVNITNPQSASMRQFAAGVRLADAAKLPPPPQLSAMKPAAVSGNKTANLQAAQQVAKENNAQNQSTLRYIPIIAGGALLGTLALQSSVGTEENYYEYRFTTDKDPDDLAGFYGSEEFMDLFCVVPFVGTLMMRGGEFDDEGAFHTTGLPGKLSVNMVFSDEQDPKTGETLWFNKRERFKDTLGDHTMWDTVMNFGFRRLPNGKLECYHTGEYFKGSAPPVSLAIKLMFQVHARWVAWATEHHLNNHAFNSETEADEAIEECSRKDMPLHLLKDHLLTDLKAMLLGAEEKPTKTLDNTTANQTPEQPSEDTINTPPANAVTVEPTPKPSFLLSNAREGSVLYDELPIKKQLPMSRIKADIEQDKKAHKNVQLSEDDFGYRNLGGNQAWELLRSTNNPEVYQKVTQAALQRHQTRVAQRQLTAADSEKTPAKTKPNRSDP